MSLRATLTRRRGTPAWDWMIRGAGVAAALGIYPTIHSPDVAGMVAFLCITMFLHGPMAPLLPAAHEAVLMVTGRVYAPLLVAAVGIAGTLYMEYINYYVYRAALHHQRFEVARQSQVVRTTVGLFQKAPFFAVWMCSWSPLPYWAVRFLAPLAGYDVRRYLLATLLGRAPRYYFIALVGKVLPISNAALAIVTALLIAVAVAIGMVQRARLRRRTAANAAGEEAVAG